MLQIALRFVPDSIITQITVIFCPRLENNTCCSSFVVTLNSQSGVILLRCHYSMDGLVGFLRFGEGTLATYGPGSTE